MTIHTIKGVSAELNPHESQVTPTIYALDIDAALELITRQRGKILVPKTSVGEEGEYGYYALFEDPEGNKFCLYSDKRA